MAEFSTKQKSKVTRIILHLKGNAADSCVGERPKADGYFPWKVKHPAQFVDAIVAGTERVDGVIVENIERESLILTILAENKEAANVFVKTEAEKAIAERVNERLREYSRQHFDDIGTFSTSELVSTLKFEMTEGEVNDAKRRAAGNIKSAKERGLKEPAFYPQTTPASDSSSNDSNSAGTEVTANDLLEIVERLEKLDCTKTRELSKEEQLFKVSIDIRNGITKYKETFPDRRAKTLVRDVAKEICEVIIRNVSASAIEIMQLAQKLRTKKEHSDAVVFYHVAAVYFSQVESVESAKEIRKCAQGVKAIRDEIDKRNDLTINAVHAMEHMRDLIAKMDSVNQEIVTLEEVACVRLIVASEMSQNDWKKCLDLNRQIKRLMKDKFGQEACTHRVYGACLHDLGHIYSKLSMLSDSKKYSQKALDARKRARDYESESEKERQIKQTQKNLDLVEKLLKKSHK